MRYTSTRRTLCAATRNCLAAFEALEQRMMLASSPPLAWTSYLGGSTQDNARAIAVDSAGNLYVAGNTQSQEWVSGGFDTTADGAEAIVSKINADGTLAWTSYVGGEDSRVAFAVAVDAAGNVYVAGQSIENNNDAFVTKIDANGQLAWTHLIGGDGFDAASGIAVNSAGQVYVSGYTDSAGWISGGYDTTFGGNQRYDGFVAKLQADGTLAWSTYVGGDLADSAYAIALDPAGNAFVAGETFSEGWVSGGYDTTYDNVGNAFVAKVNADGSFGWSSYISANFLWSYEYGYGNSSAFAVATDGVGNAYVAGQTWSNDFEYTDNAFVLKISSGGTKGWLTYVGGNEGNESGRGIAVAADGSVYLTGQTNGSDWVSGGFDTTLGDWDSDAFVAKLSNGGTVEWSSYLGGSSEDRGRAIALGSGGSVFVAGYTASDDWVSGGFDTTYGAGFYDGFVASIGQGSAPAPLIITGTAGDDNVQAQRVGDSVRVTVNGEVVEDRALALVSQIRISGMAGDDQVSILAGLPGAFVDGGAGHDTINGGDGADLVYGGDGDDVLFGWEGVDTIYGNFGNDAIAGGLKRDSLLGGLGNDTITSGDGPDSVYGGDGTDLLRGGKGADYIEGRGKSDTIYGGLASDTIISGAGSDLVYGEEDDDWLYATPASVFHDTLDGGAGSDRYEADADDTLVSAEVNLLA